MLSQKNGDPISDTIARYISLLIADDDSKYKVYKDTKTLYATRSGLVHSGKRYISKDECGHLQTFTELVCIKAIDRFIDLDEESFHDMLKKHSISGTRP